MARSLLRVLRVTRWLALVLLAALALGGCVVSPQPSPPNLHPEGVTLRDPSSDVIDGIRLIGEPGTVDPAEGVVVATSLDADVPPIVEPVRDDGSFQIVVGGSGEHRLQVRDGSARSIPFDFVIDVASLTLAPAPRPLEDCLVLEPAYELDFGDVRAGASAERQVRIENGCGSEVTLAPSRLRESAAPITTIDGELTLPPGGSTAITVRAAPTGPGGAVEATLFVEAIAPMRDRRPLTLFVRAIE